MKPRAIVIAATLPEGRKWVERGRAQHILDIEVVAIITPRARHRARGILADLIVSTEGAHALDHNTFAQLLAEAEPCLATSTWRNS
ncbi:hypothetical protein [Glaciibacter psychrotolerans]|uniref:Uncharacterized protein n=1 Tax=Glaciibacter psychrotolerans TaxID=670054 RepID=A0A7Z0EFP6_9MICO|nr:hypothetical protein [Leifsonia psychrotolerans]NYJ20817.1 hypothetical protein [Leifsonia psychrotolerans]